MRGREGGRGKGWKQNYRAWRRGKKRGGEEMAGEEEEEESGKQNLEKRLLPYKATREMMLQKPPDP